VSGSWKRRSPIFEAVTIVFAMLLIAPAIAKAQGISDLEPERPITVEDARPVSYRAFSGSADWAFSRRRGGLNDYGPGFALLYGAARGLEVGANIRYVTSPGRNSLRGISSGDLFLHGLYSLAGETAGWPALAIRAAVQLPTGLASKGTNLHMTALATRSYDAFRLHANLQWTRLGDSAPGTRRERFEAVAGTDFTVGRRWLTDSLVLADFLVRTNPVIGGATIFAAEVGLRQRTGMQTVFYAGAGSEFTGRRDRARFRVRVGITRAY
jgi:hypothetical protein